MVEIGYGLSSEEFSPRDLVGLAQMAEEVGFTFALISDHYHPWISQQGHSPFVWSVLGGISQATEKLRLGTGVTCPIMRIHPTIIAQAAATTAALMPGRFFLGLGSGEALKEHILGDHWPEASVRLEMLEEAIQIIRGLWQGEEQSYYGDYYVVENAKLYTLPDELPPIYLAVGGSTSAELAGRTADGLISVGMEEKVLSKFDEAGGKGKPRITQHKVCWDEDEAKARDLVLKLWPTNALPGSMRVDLPTTDHFEAAVKLVRPEDLPESIVYGAEKQKHIEGIQNLIDAGFDHIYVQQIGPNQKAFFEFYKKEVLPVFRPQR